MPQWTPERRKRQAELIRRWQPWKASTGPKTEEGKDTAKMNATKSGAYSAEMKQFKRLMRELCT